MKSFGIKRDANDPRWAKFIEWWNKQSGNKWSGVDDSYYGISRTGKCRCSNFKENFDRIITLDEWESEFMQPKLAGREYDEKLIRQWHLNCCLPIEQFLNQRYAKTDRIAEIKAEINKLNNELKELEG